MTSFRTPSYGQTGHRILLISSLLGVLAGLTGYLTHKKWLIKVMVKKCPNPKTCQMTGYHTHHLTLLGKWYYIYRHYLWSLFVPDLRPQPQPGEQWYQKYTRDWQDHYHVPCRSCWVRDEDAHWVWVTDTPIFDREWFDKKGWQFPAKWITIASRDFYTLGADSISTIVSV